MFCCCQPLGSNRQVTCRRINLVVSQCDAGEEASILDGARKTASAPASLTDFKSGTPVAHSTSDKSHNRKWPTRGAQGPRVHPRIDAGVDSAEINRRARATRVARDEKGLGGIARYLKAVITIAGAVLDIAQIGGWGKF